VLCGTLPRSETAGGPPSGIGLGDTGGLTRGARGVWMSRLPESNTAGGARGAAVLWAPLRSET